MSLTSFLLGAKFSGKRNSIDTELDSIFRSQTAEERPESSSNDHPSAKKKRRNLDAHPNKPDRKRTKFSLATAASPSVLPPRKEKKNEKKCAAIVSGRASERVISDAEGSGSSSSVSTSNSGSQTSDEPDEDGDQSLTLMHETLQKDRSGKRMSRIAKYAPSDETRERRDARTIFIGNLAPDVAVKRPLQKQLHRHILALVPTAKIESTRFRSIAFKTPTSELPKGNEEEKRHRQLRQHERDRASSWRDANPTGESKADEKKFLTPNQRKKIAFINRDIHSDADSVHAYVVFAHPLPHSRPANLPPLPPVMDPLEAVRTAVEKCNGTMFLDRMLRVDTIVKRSTLESPFDGTPPSSVTGDPKLSIFVGNLDFASKEEDLRVFFEGIVSAERGPPDSEGRDTPMRWVTRVRMIRDKDTQLGKGFAYVQFSDRTCVDEILALEPGKLKFAKRKLRVQRCKSISKATSSKIVSQKPAQTSDRAPVPSIPKGDPSLGEKLAKLTKEERKRIKAADADRVARRVAKKRARLELAKQGVAPLVKQRQRAHKTVAAKRLGDAAPKKASKGRVRSEKSMAKKNTKK